MPTFSKLTAIAASRNSVYSATPLQCPLGVDLYNDIVVVRNYLADVRALALQNAMVESMFLS